MSEGQTPPPASPPPPGPTMNYATPSGSGYQGPAPDKDAKTMGMLCHLLALAGLIIPLGSIIGPLVIWLMKKDSHPFVNDQGKESLNFQITIAIAMVVCILLAFVLIGFLLIPVVGIAALVFVIIATLKANEGIAYRYPFAIRLIK
jgi:uncharacterized protein